MSDQPRPRRPLRTLTLGALVGVAALAGATAWALHREARYALEGEVPLELGSLAMAELDARHEGRYVRARVELEGQPAYSFHRLGEGERRLARTGYPTPSDPAPRGPGEMRAWGGGPPRYVDHAVPSELGGHFVPPRLVAGRLVRVEHLGLRHRGLAAAAAEIAPESAVQGWVLVDGEHPRSLTWVAGAVGVSLAFFVWSLGSVARLVRREPAA